MKLNKTILSLGTVAAAGIPIAAVISCGGRPEVGQKTSAGEIFGRLELGSEGWDSEIKIGIHPSQTLSKEQTLNIEKSADEYNTLVNNSFVKGYVDQLLTDGKIDTKTHDALVSKTFRITVKVIDSQQAIATSLDTGEIDYAFLPSGIAVKYNKTHKGFVPELIAARNADIFEEMTGNGFPTKTQEEFQQKLQHDITAGATSTTSGYEKLEHTYEDKSHTVSAYRSQIYITGDKTTRDQIKKAWNDRDWVKFKSYGIAAKAASSESGYLIPEKMIKKQFGNSFTTMANEAKNDNEHIKVGVKPDAILKAGGAKIGFSFSNNPIQSASKWPALGDIEVLSTSVAIPNDILVARGGLNRVEAELISKMIKDGLIANPKIQTSHAFYHATYNEIFDWSSKQKLVDSIHELDNFYSNPQDLYIKVK